MLETKKVKEVKRETRSNNSMPKSMTEKVHAELLSNKLKQLLMKKRSREKKTKS